MNHSNNDKSTKRIRFNNYLKHLLITPRSDRHTGSQECQRKKKRSDRFKLAMTEKQWQNVLKNEYKSCEWNAFNALKIIYPYGWSLSAGIRAICTA